jgi:hypothetical protein
MAATPATGPPGGGDGRAADVIGGLTHAEPPLGGGATAVEGCGSGAAMLGFSLPGRPHGSDAGGLLRS